MFGNSNFSEGNRSRIFVSSTEEGVHFEVKNLKVYQYVCMYGIFLRRLTLAMVHIRLIAFIVLCTGSIRRLLPRNLEKKFKS